MNTFKVKTEAPNSKKGEDKWSAFACGITTYGKTERIALRKLMEALCDAQEGKLNS